MSPAARAVRSDVLRNRAALLDAAAAAFAQDGPNVSLDEIARRAGLGAGTLHRHFPTKNALIEAVLVHRLEELGRRAQACCAADEPTAAFFDFLAVIAAEAGQNMTLASALDDPAALSERVAEAGQALQAAFAELLRRAQDAGGVRSDVTAVELHALVTGVIATERALPEESRGRGLAVVADGLRAASGSPEGPARAPRRA
ncbi:TetR/AcrR family transcriptional regulator [Pseudonocardia sp. CA-107938]|uniref:TetR/AcrR family transcriptional regulator n=1 Tax=Pseudonocardia sp. CA-107938 TaxID=3240021 RepID=UPI003D911E60